MKRLSRFISFFFLGLVVLIILAGIFTQTPIFRNWLKDWASEVLDAGWNTKTTVGALHGNLFSYVQIEDLVIKQKAGDFLKIKRARLRYSLLGVLFKRIVVREITLEEPELRWVQLNDNAENVSELSHTADTPNGMNLPRLGWSIIAPRIRIRAGKATLPARQASFRLPSHIRELNVELGVWLENQRVRVALQNLYLETSDPDFLVRTVQSDVHLDSTNLELKQLEIETKSSKLNSELSIKDFSNPVLNFLVRGQPISFSEIRRVFPNFPLYGNPRIAIEARGPIDDLQLSCRFLTGRGLIEVGGKLQVKDLPYEYDLTGKVSRFDLGEITHRQELNSDLNIRFSASGKGLDWGKMTATMSVELDSSDFHGVILDPSSLEATVRGDTLNLNLNAASGSARAKFSGMILYNPSYLDYRLNGQVRSFRAENFYPIENMSSDLAFDIALQGSGKDLETMTGKADIKFFPSMINGVPVESARFGLQLDRGMLFLDKFNVNSPSGTISANGNVSLQKDNALTLRANFTDFSVFSAVLPVEKIQGAGVLSARAEGPRDSLQVRMEFELNRVGINDILVDKFQAEGSGLVSPTELTFNFRGKATDVSRSGINLDVVDFKLNHADSSSKFDIKLEQTDRLKVAIVGKFAPLADGGASIDLTALDAVYFQQKWHMRDRTNIRIHNSRFAVSDFNFVSGEQTLSVSGFFDTEAENGLSAQVAKFDIAKYDSILGLHQELSGSVDVDLKLAGTLDKPQVSGGVQINNGKYLQTGFHRFVAGLQYQPEKLTWNCVLSRTAGDSLMESSGHLPLALSLAPFKTQLLRDEQLVAKLSSRGLDLSILQKFTPGVTNMKGTLVADIVLSNTLNDLRGVGPIRVVNGEFEIPELGTKYRKVNLAFLVRDKQIIIRDFRMRSGGGYLEALEGALSVSEQNVEEFGAKFKVKHFEVMNNRKMRARAEGEIAVSGSIQSPLVSGELIIDQARINYKEWLGEETGVLLTSRPFFVVSDDSVQFDTTGALRFQKSFEGAETSIADMALYKNLRGEITLRFPRNTWIRGDEVNIEISGELAAAKTGSDIVLFGSLSTLRGYYQLLGRRFQIQQGELVFLGKPEPDPDVSIEAVHEFREDSGQSSEKHEFKVVVSGTLTLPKFQFLLDGQEAKQQDVLSVLLFGQDFEHLTAGEAASGNSGLESQAAGIFTRQLMGTLTQKLGQELKLDLIQLERGKDWQDTKVRVGKYLTPEVFVSVSQDFSTEGNRKVELEYQIPRKLLFFNLFLQASTEGKENTAMDVIWKIEW